MLTSNPYHAKDGERRGGTVGFPLPGVQRARASTTTAAPAAPARSAASRSRARTCSRATGACPRRRPRSSPPTAGSRPATSASVDERGVRHHRRPQQGPDHQRRLQRLPGRDRGLRSTSMPGVAESAVIGVPHPRLRRGAWSRSSCAQARRSAATPQALIAELKAQIANFKVPKRVFVVAELPRNAMGKVQKNLLREQHKGLFALRLEPRGAAMKKAGPVARRGRPMRRARRGRATWRAPTPRARRCRASRRPCRCHRPPSSARRWRVHANSTNPTINFHMVLLSGCCS